MTALITATVITAFIYFAAAFVHHSADSICRRHKAAIRIAVSQARGWDEAITELEEALGCDTAQESTSIDLPTSIRGLRDYVRSHQLQARIKAISGKSVSSLKKDELMKAVEMAIA